MIRNIITITAALSLVAFPAFGQTTSPRIRSIIESFNSKVLVVKVPDGLSMAAAVPADLKIIANVNAKLTDIQSGDFVGSAAVKGPNGKLRAEEVHIYLELMRGPGEGHRPIGPVPAKPMPNGTIAISDPEARTMTNGIVITNAGSGAMILTIQHKDREQRVEFTPRTPIIMLIFTHRCLLVLGSNVSLAGVQKDAELVATFLTAEKDGAKPRKSTDRPALSAKNKSYFH